MEQYRAVVDQESERALETLRELPIALHTTAKGDTKAHLTTARECHLLIRDAVGVLQTKIHFAQEKYSNGDQMARNVREKLIRDLGCICGIVDAMVGYEASHYLTVAKARHYGSDTKDFEDVMERQFVWKIRSFLMDASELIARFIDEFDKNKEILWSSESDHAHYV